ncbi:MAG: YIP1 family protein [Alphaproteobacteria bacterium]|nr:MAG: YIP1 family protein [Alphaproteobacteria bacterium]
MTISLRSLVSLALASIRDPRGGAQEVMRMGRGLLDRRQRWEMLALVVVLSALLTELTMLLLPAGASLILPLKLGPIAMTLLQFGLMVLTVQAIHWVGRAAGGKGSLDDAILLTAWLQAILLGLQLIQSLAMVLAPPLVSAVTLAGVLLWPWLMTGFVAALHGFSSLLKVFAGVVVTSFGVGLALSVILAMIGAVPRGL